MRPPFHPSPDAWRCLQATLRMAIEGVRPGTTVPFRVLDVLTRRRPGEGTWTHAAYLALPHLGVEARAIDPFDYAAFASDPRRTLLRTYPGAVAARMVVDHDLSHAAALARVLLELDPIPREVRPPTLDDVDAALDAGWLLILNVDAHALDDGPDLSGHSLLVFGRAGGTYQTHDPGTEGRGTPDRAVERERLLRAWSYLGDDQRELLAIRGGPPAAP
jgi:hypothetical protein